MIKEFRDFILRGNVVELATALVIGLAFQAIITAIVDNLINPVVAALGGANVEGLSFEIVAGNTASRVDIGAVISAVIAFLITAAVVFFVFVKPLNKLMGRFAAKPQEPATPDDVVLLREIRDLLRERSDRSV
ncbi:MAG: large conductance mechanosensitive channel protein MscL [Kineosporiaceae bacterium]